jgi:hypothetical protein
MSTYLYAISGADATVPACDGVNGASLRLVLTPALSAVVSTNEDRADLGTQEDLWAHEQVVEELLSHNDVLPARFGTRLRDDAAVRRLLLEREVEFTGALARVAGSFEVAIRVAALTPGSQEPQEPRSGTEYLEEARRQKHLAERVSEQIERSLGPLARARRITAGSDARRLVESAWLIDRERLAEFRDRAAQLNAHTDDAELLCTGPWPPYSFVSAEESV